MKLNILRLENYVWKNCIYAKNLHNKWYNNVPNNLSYIKSFSNKIDSVVKINEISKTYANALFSYTEILGQGLIK